MSVPTSTPAPATGLPPSAPTAAAPTVADGSPAEARYAQLRLMRNPAEPWRVVDGTGREVDVREWARLSGDDGPLKRATRARPLAAGLVPRVAGALLVGAACALPLALEPSTGGPGEHDWARDNTRNNLIVAGTFTLGSAGVGLVLASLTTPTDRVVRYPLGPENADRVAVDKQIEAYNSDLRRALGLP